MLKSILKIDYLRKNYSKHNPLHEFFEISNIDLAKDKKKYKEM